MFGVSVAAVVVETFADSVARMDLQTVHSDYIICEKILRTIQQTLDYHWNI